MGAARSTSHNGRSVTFSGTAVPSFVCVCVSILNATFVFFFLHFKLVPKSVKNKSSSLISMYRLFVKIVNCICNLQMCRHWFVTNITAWYCFVYTFFVHEARKIFHSRYILFYIHSIWFPWHKTGSCWMSWAAYERKNGEVTRICRVLNLFRGNWWI